MLTSVLQMIPLAVAGVMLMIAAITIYVRSKRLTRREFYKMFKRIKPLTVWVLVFTLVLTGVFAVCHHLKTHLADIPAIYLSEIFHINLFLPKQRDNGTLSKPFHHNLEHLPTRSYAHIDIQRAGATHLMQ